MKSRTLALSSAMVLSAALAMTVQLSASPNTITTIRLNDLNAGSSSGQGTVGFGINPLGVVVGYYIDATNVYHGFVTNPPYITFRTIDAPGAGAGVSGVSPCPTFGPDAPLYQGTLVYGINLEGAITGQYTDKGCVSHGFVSKPPYTTITTINAPGAGAHGPCVLDPSYNPLTEGNSPLEVADQATQGLDIDLTGTIAGYYIDANCVSHGFVTNPPYTTFKTINAPGAGTGFTPGTFTLEGTSIDAFTGLNQLGEITGYSVGSALSASAFVSKPPYTTITTFDVEIDSAPVPYTYSSSINLLGTIAGLYYDQSNLEHGFVRSSNGSISTFDASSATGALTEVSNINLEGAITGYYTLTSGVAYGYVRSPLGSITSFSASGAGTASGQGTFPVSNDLEGGITGYYIDADNVYHGFVGKQ